MRRTSATVLLALDDGEVSLASMACSACGGPVNDPAGLTIYGQQVSANGATERVWCSEVCARSQGWPALSGEKVSAKRLADRQENFPKSLSLKEHFVNPEPVWNDPPGLEGLDVQPPLMSFGDQPKARAPKRDRGTFEIGEIESGVPIPPRRGKADDIPFGDLLVGQSVVVRGISCSGVYSAAKRWHEKFRHTEPLWEFTARDVDDTAVRVWRTK